MLLSHQRLSAHVASWFFTTAVVRSCRFLVFYNSGCPLMSLPRLFKTAVVRSSRLCAAVVRSCAAVVRSCAAVVRSCCYQLFFVVVKEALFMRSTWLLPTSTDLYGCFHFFGGYLRLSCGCLPAIFALSSNFWRLSLAIFRLSSGFLAIFRLSLAIFRLSTGYLCLSSRYLPPILDFPVLSFNYLGQLCGQWPKY